MPRAAAISPSFMSCCQRSTATACCLSGMSLMICQHRSSVIDEKAVLRIRRGLAIPGLNPWQPVAERRLPPEAADRDVGQGCPQPGPALRHLTGTAGSTRPGRLPQRRPEPDPGPARDHRGPGSRRTRTARERGRSKHAASSSASPGEIFSSPTHASVRELTHWSGTTRPGYGHPGRPAPGRSCPRKAPAAADGCTAHPKRITGVSRTAATKPLPPPAVRPCQGCRPGAVSARAGTG